MDLYNNPTPAAHPPQPALEFVECALDQPPDATVPNLDGPTGLFLGKKTSYAKVATYESGEDADTYQHVEGEDLASSGTFISAGEMSCRRGREVVPPEGGGVSRMGERLRSEEGMEMVELQFDELDGEARYSEFEKEEEDVSMEDLKMMGEKEAMWRRMWRTLGQVEWGDILLHDAVSPFVSYWGLWLFGFGFAVGTTVQWLAFLPLVLASIACVIKTVVVGLRADWAYDGNDFVERLFGRTFPAILFPVGVLLVHLKRLDLLEHASWPVVLIPFWTIYASFLFFPVISLFLYAALRRSLGTVGPFECSWYYLLKWPLVIPTVVFNIMLSVREDLPWVVAFLPLCLALFSSLMSCFYLHLPNTKEVERFMNYADHSPV